EFESPPSMGRKSCPRHYPGCEERKGEAKQSKGGSCMPSVSRDHANTVQVWKGKQVWKQVWKYGMVRIRKAMLDELDVRERMEGGDNSLERFVLKFAMMNDADRERPAICISRNRTCTCTRPLA